MAATPLLMRPTRDPAQCPQPGDVARAKGQPSRRVLEVRNGKLLIQTPMTRFLLNLPAWRAWCERTGAEFEIERSKPMKLNEEERSALRACDTSAGVSSEGYIPAKANLQSLVDLGLLMIARTEIVGGWRQYQWFRTTPEGRKYKTAT